MKILAVQIQQQGNLTLTDLIAEIHALPLADRRFAGSDLRLDEANLEGDLHTYADFAKARGGHGPGRMSRHAPLTEIDLGEDEFFGEDTGLVFDRPTGRAALQFNQFGPRLRAIEDYINIAARNLGHDQTSFSFGQCLKPDAYARLAQLGLYKEIDYKISVPGADRAGLAAGRSVGEMLRAPLPGGVETINVTLAASTKRDSSLNPEGVMAIVNDLQRAGDAVKRAVVKGRDVNGRRERIDLIEEFLSVEADLRPARGHRYARPDRWISLRNALNAWRAEGGPFA